MMIALVALSIDTVLPALPDIGQDLGVQRANHNQLIISLLFVGLAVGQLIYGPVSDSTGRKPAIYAGFALLIVGCLLSLAATSFPMVLAGRVIQGVGVAGPRVVTVALVRDQYKGRAMAQVMSFVMAVFILVPIIAPSLGQGILLFAGWRAIFATYLGLALVVLAWFAFRQPETLAPSQRLPFSLGRIVTGIREVLTTRIAIGYTMAAGLIFGAFLGYLNSTQQIFQEQYGLGRLFPLYFGVLAVSFGCASVLNTRLVMRYGMRRLTTWSSLTIGTLSTAFLAVAYVHAGHPPLWVLMAFFLTVFFCVGLLFGNLNALAMEPLGHIAGVGAAVVGALTTTISLLLGILIGQSYNGTVLPLIGGFAILSLASAAAMRWAEHKESVPQPG
jgi:DHA1 family bicyclomycin/chloramphenicol resistance-like MFS transporter